MIRALLIGLLLLIPAHAQATHFYSTRAEQALEALITTNSRCCSITTLYTHGGTLIGRFPVADGTVGQALTTNGAGTWSFTTVGSGTVTGTGTATHLARWSSASAIGDATVTETSGALAGITTASMSGQLTSTLATGTPPFVVASTTQVANLYAARAALADVASAVAFSAVTAGTNAAALVVGTGGTLGVSGSGTINATTLNSATFAAPGAIGGGTPSTAAFTTVSATGQITSTLSTGTAPFVIASTTVVANLNASALGGATFAAPGTIGGGTAAAATFTTLGASTTTLSGDLLFSAGSNIGLNATTSRPATLFLSSAININNGSITLSGGNLTINSATGEFTTGAGSRDIRLARSGTKTFTIDDNAGGAAQLIVTGLKTTGAATGKTVVCVDTATGQLFASSSGVACAN